MNYPSTTTTPEQPAQRTHFEAARGYPLTTTLRGVGSAAYTNFRVPPHEALFTDLAEQLRHEPQPIHPPVAQEMDALSQNALSLVDTDIRPQIKSRAVLAHLGMLMQFTEHTPRLHPHAETSFQHVDALYEAIVDGGSEQPLTISDQLTIALQQTQGDLPESLWRLFLTSRQHARWLDSNVLAGMPALSGDEKLERMRKFSTSVAAFKSPETTVDQDTAGDTYYMWTHALGKVAFGALTPRRTPLAKASEAAINNGTRLVHGIAHRFGGKQKLPSDHSIAATYGNAAGELMVQRLRPAVSNARRAVAGRGFSVEESSLNLAEAS